MKRIIVILIMTISVFSSCKKDDDNLIIGNWQTVKVGNKDFNYPIFSFKSNGEFSEQWSKDNTKRNGFYTLNGKELILNDDLMFEIVSLSHNKLVVFVSGRKNNDDPMIGGEQMTMKKL
ncbi:MULTISPECIES: hypothetical protein [unclassified Sphingobacterium]|uniref:hypothetical protein n=1 Tax=unclassified Sphingobacterium TaxID=2609468 RepID=UPI0025FC0A09|nr:MULTISPECIES: hypothetical protein [unclassified Sphingobacterium]